MAETISSKRKFLELYLNDSLGNKFRTWRSLEDFLTSDCQLVGVRSYERGGPFKMVSRAEIERIVKEWPGEYYLNEGDYNAQSNATIQGELLVNENGYNLYIGPANVYKMREMFTHNLAKQYYGLRARLTMKHYMNDNSLDEVDLLLERYPNHVIEFTCYSITLGNLPRRNTIIWEVRNY